MHYDNSTRARRVFALRGHAAYPIWRDTVPDDRNNDCGVRVGLKSLMGVIVGALLGLTVPLAAHGAGEEPPPGFVALFNGRDFSGWKVPEGDGGHWKVVEGVIDYDAESEAKGDKSLWTEREFGDHVLLVDWRIKEAPYINRGIPYILPDGSHARDIRGEEMRLALPDADSGIYIRGSDSHQINIWCWPIGSGEIYGIRTNPKTPPALRAAATPRTQADKPIGQWNRFEITARGETIKVVLNGKTVLPEAEFPGLPTSGRIALQHHGLKRGGEWVGPPSLLQYKNLYIKELDKSSK